MLTVSVVLETGVVLVAGVVVEVGVVFVVVVAVAVAFVLVGVAVTVAGVFHGLDAELDKAIKIGVVGTAAG